MGERRVALRLGWEHTHRELLPALIALNVLKRRGVTARLEHMSSLGAAPGGREVVLMPFYYDDQVRDRYLTLHDLPARWFVNLAYEQMHFRCGRGYLLPDGDFPREQMLHCAWGDVFHDLLVGHGIPEERIRVTGHPRFDLYHRPELLLGRRALAEQFDLDRDAPWVLIPYNFNMAYISDLLRRQLVARKYELTSEFLAGFARARDAFTDLVRMLADEFPEVVFILRVHPAGYEAESLYHGESKRRPNIRVIAEFDIANWISEAALTITWNSTSSLEAMVAGRPVVCYEPFPFSEIFDYDVNRIVKTFHSKDDIMEVVRRLPNPDLSHDWQLFERWHRYRDGGNIERLCSIVDEAEQDYERFVCRASTASSRRVSVGRRVARLLSGAPKARRVAERILGVDSPPVTPAPPPDALERAVSELSSVPLLDYLR